MTRSDGDGSYAIERKQGEVDWYLKSPLEGITDRVLMATLLDELNSWRIETFLSDDLKNSADYGFDAPRLTVALTLSDGQAVFGVGKAVQAGTMPEEDKFAPRFCLLSKADGTTLLGVVSAAVVADVEKALGDIGRGR